MPKDIEKFWRTRISKEILKLCTHSVEPCVDCRILSVLIHNGNKFSELEVVE